MKHFSLFFILTLVIEIAFSQQLALGHLTQFNVASDVLPKIKQQAKPDDVWNDVTVDLNWLLGGINSKSCAGSQKTYIGCVMAVQAFASVLKKNLEVIPVALLNGKLPFYQADRLALVEMPLPSIKTPKEAFGYFEQVRKQLNSRFFAASAVFIRNPNTDFELMLTELNKRAGVDAKPAVFVAAATKYFESARDPHTSLRPTKEMELASSENGASFVGIGVEFVKLEHGLMVKRVLKGSGASLAGVQVGDIVTAADSKTFKGLSDEDMVAAMRGVENSTVKLTVERTLKVMDFSIVRKKIVDPVVSSEGMSFNGKSIVYIRLNNFMYSNICDEFAGVISAWDKKNIAGYVLDLRNNPGGNVLIASCVGGMFLGNNKVISYFEKKSMFGVQYDSMPTKASVKTDKPLSVLVNAYSASASELVSGAIRDYNRGYIVGQTSFGKGSYQGCSPLKNQGELTVCSTQGLFFAPSGNSNQTVGIEPHISVYLNKEVQESETYAMREAQMYLFPLPARTMPNAPAGTWNQLKAPKQCIRNLKLESVYDEAVSSIPYYKDYQLLNGLAAIDCWGAQ
jgi:C-terminal peptidase prc